MEFYLSVKTLHIITAIITASLFVLRLILDLIGKPGWRSSAWRYVPHINDTVLLILAFWLLTFGPWQPFVHQWLGGKIILLIGYIFSGVVALKTSYSKFVRSLATMLALLLLASIFYLAHFKPVLFS